MWVYLKAAHYKEECELLICYERTQAALMLKDIMNRFHISGASMQLVFHSNMTCFLTART